MALYWIIIWGNGQHIDITNKLKLNNAQFLVRLMSYFTNEIFRKTIVHCAASHSNHTSHASHSRVDWWGTRTQEKERIWGHRYVLSLVCVSPTSRLSSDSRPHRGALYQATKIPPVGVVPLDRCIFCDYPGALKLILVRKMITPRSLARKNRSRIDAWLLYNHREFPEITLLRDWAQAVLSC